MSESSEKIYKSTFQIWLLLQEIRNLPAIYLNLSVFKNKVLQHCKFTAKVTQYIYFLFFLFQVLHKLSNQDMIHCSISAFRFLLKPTQIYYCRVFVGNLSKSYSSLPPFFFEKNGTNFSNKSFWSYSNNSLGFTQCSKILEKTAIF